jgi:hypothetical protein
VNFAGEDGNDRGGLAALLAIAVPRPRSYGSSGYLVAREGRHGASGSLRSLSPDRDFIPFRQLHSIGRSSGTEMPHAVRQSASDTIRGRGPAEGCAQSHFRRERLGATSLSDGNRYCLVAALSVVSGSATFQKPNQVERRLARRLAAQLPSQVPLWARMRCFTARQRLMWFNDSPRTKHEDVMVLFDRAIDHQTIKVSIYITT